MLLQEVPISVGTETMLRMTTEGTKFSNEKIEHICLEEFERSLRDGRASSRST